ncbi:MAG: hypothetical protein LBE56_03250 [Tannerella sp.]|jgi:ClpP class serine protease|nr:hypothetical protein [Tannerella sp.]
MATITLHYDDRNKNINSLLGVILNLGAVAVDEPRKTDLDEALEDVKEGRVYTAKNAKSLIADCLK